MCVLPGEDRDKITGGMADYPLQPITVTLSHLRLAGAVRGTRGETAAAMVRGLTKDVFWFPLTLLGSLQLRGQNASARCYIAPSRYFQEVRWRGAARIEISENGCSKKRGAFFFLPLEKLLELSAPSSLHQWSRRVTMSRFRSFQDPRSTP